MDVLAEKMGMDPLELRYINAYRPGDTNPSGQEPEVYSMVDALDAIRPSIGGPGRGQETFHA